MVPCFCSLETSSLSYTDTNTPRKHFLQPDFAVDDVPQRRACLRFFSTCPVSLQTNYFSLVADTHAVNVLRAE